MNPSASMSRARWSTASRGHTLTVACAVAALGLLGFGSSAASAAPAEAGPAATAPAPPGAVDVQHASRNVEIQELDGVAVLSQTDAWAVGRTGYTPKPLVLHYVSEQWKVVKTPAVSGGGALKGVTAVSASDIWAVGHAGAAALAEHWDGTSWSVVPTPPTSGRATLSAVSAVDANDVWAVGTRGVAALVEHWDGSAWSIVRAGAAVCQGTTLLNGVVAVSADHAWAAGTCVPGNRKPPVSFMETWDGASWSTTQSQEGEISAIGADSATDVWAVGQGRTGGVAFHFDGTTWHPVGIPSLEFASGVEVDGPDDVGVVGNPEFGAGNTPIAHWDGTTWSSAPTPKLSGTSSIVAIAGGRVGEDFAVGNLKMSGQFGSFEQTVVLAGTNDPNSGFIRMHSPNPLGPLVGWIKQISTDSTTDAWAIGIEENNASTLLRHWNGTDWARVSVPHPGGQAAQDLFGQVVAFGPADVWIFGDESTTPGTVTALAFHYDGTQWHRSPLPQSVTHGFPDAAGAAGPDAIWVGGMLGNGQGFVLAWNGTTWTVADTMNHYADFSAAAASSPSDVWLVGVTFDNGYLPFTLHWDGASWTEEDAGLPATTYAVAGVADIDGHTMIAGPRFGNELEWSGTQWAQMPGSVPDGTSTSLAADSTTDAWETGVLDSTGGTGCNHWDGTSWKTAACAPAGKSNAIAVAAAAPDAVWIGGDVEAPNGQPHPMIRAWNGSTWTTQLPG